MIFIYMLALVVTAALILRGFGYALAGVKKSREDKTSIGDCLAAAILVVGPGIAFAYYIQLVIPEITV